MLIHLSIHHLRNLHAVSIAVGACNVFVGVNGSGKTSLLEALHLLSRGKSFRHAQPKRYISHHYPHVTVHAKFADGDSMAIQKHQDASTVMRLGQQTVYTQSPLAKRLPTLLIDPSSMDLLELGSSNRRQLLDWITFHVKQNFHPQWLAYQRLLRQRNALLKQTQSLTRGQKQELAAWDEGLAIHAGLITHYRQQVFDAWKPLFDELIKKLLPDYAAFIQLRFLPGYNTDIALNELLQHRVEQDCKLGYTRIGCHRADIQVLWVDDAAARQNDVVKPQYRDNAYQADATNQNAKEANRSAKPPMAYPQNEDEDAESGLDRDGEDNDDNDDDDDIADLGCSGSKTLREQAANVLSRGEKKLLITALRLSQLPLLAQQQSLSSVATTSPLTLSDTSTTVTDEPALADAVHLAAAYDSASTILPLVLLDDITAELDERALTILLETLAQLSCQVFVTSLDSSVIKRLGKYWQHVAVFHVKHGEIQPVDAAAY